MNSTSFFDNRPEWCITCSGNFLYYGLSVTEVLMITDGEFNSVLLLQWRQDMFIGAA